MRLCWLFIVTIVAATLCRTAAGSRYHAAKCLAEGTRCTSQIAQKSDTCLPSRRPREQPAKCRRLACLWCELKGKRALYPCNELPLTSLCDEGSVTRPTPSPKPIASSPRPVRRSPSPRPARSPSPPQTKGANCVWTANTPSNSIVIDLSAVARPASGWTRTSRSGFSGLVYEKSKNGGIDPAGKKGVMCFNVRASSSGNYFFAALSYAPHPTEHNDMWVNSPTYGFELWQANKKWRNASTKEWLKAYQNNGNKGLSVSLKTKDFDGHRFIVPNVVAGQDFRICMSGRSYKYEVFRLYLVKCSGDFCKGRPITDLQQRPVSKCV